MLENQKENIAKKKLNLQSANPFEEEANSAKNRLRQNIFNILFPDFLACEVNNIRASFTIYKCFYNNSQIPFELSQIALMNIAQDPKRGLLLTFQATEIVGYMPHKYQAFIVLEHEYV